MGDRIDLPGNSDLLCFGSNNDEQPCQLIATEIAGGKCGSAAGRLLRNRHSFYPVTVSMSPAFDGTPCAISRLHDAWMILDTRTAGAQTRTAFHFDERSGRSNSLAEVRSASRDSISTPPARSPLATILVSDASPCPTSPLVAGWRLSAYEFPRPIRQTPTIAAQKSPKSSGHPESDIPRRCGVLLM